MPGVSDAGSTSYLKSKSSAVSPNAWPARNAARFDAFTSSFLAKRSSIQAIVSSTGRVYIQLMRPSAKKFFERSASRGFTPSGFVASTVIVNVDTFDERNLKKAGYDANPLEDGSLAAYTVFEVPMTSITLEATKPLGVKPRDADFDATLDRTIQSIYEASIA